MCGIVGLLVKTPDLREQLGELMVPMLIGMTERGPDSAGLAVFTESLAETSRKISVYSGLTADAADFNWQALGHGIKTHLGVEAKVEAKGNHAVITIEGAVDDEQKKRMADIAERTPVTLTLKGGLEIRTRLG